MVAPYTYQAVPWPSVENARLTGCCAETTSAPARSAGTTARAVQMRACLIVGPPLCCVSDQRELRALRLSFVERAEVVARGAQRRRGRRRSPRPEPRVQRRRPGAFRRDDLPGVRTDLD